MPHIHTEPNQHDMTVSAYIIRRENDEWKCLVHKHRRLHVLMQVGGHIELDETPWQSAEHEIREESGYTLAELRVLQWPATRSGVRGAIVHPAPVMVNTHTAGPGPHYHSDLCYAFEAVERPTSPPTAGESDDLRWLTLAELQRLEASETGERILGDVVDIYRELLANEPGYERIPATDFSLEKPVDHWNFPGQSSGQTKQ